MLIAELLAKALAKQGADHRERALKTPMMEICFVFYGLPVFFLPVTSVVYIIALK